MGIFSPIGAINMVVVGITQMRDTIFVLIRVFFKPFVRQSPEEDKDSIELRNVLCVVPTYKEEAKEVSITVSYSLSVESYSQICLKVNTK